MRRKVDRHQDIAVSPVFVSLGPVGTLQQPLPCILELLAVEVLQLCIDECLADGCHPALQVTLADDRNAFEITLMLHTELQVFPGSFRFPALEVLETNQQRDGLVLLEYLFESGNEPPVVGFSQLATRREGVEM